MTRAIDAVLMAVSQMTDPDKLTEIVQACQDRRRALAKLAVSSVRPGQKVKFASAIRPAYLAGLEASVVSINRESVTVSCPSDLRYGRFSGVNKVRVPVSLIAA